MWINWEYYKTLKPKLKMSDGLTEALRGTYFQNKNTVKEFLYFSASWCEPCKTLSPIMEELKNEGYIVKKIDVDSNPELSQNFGIRNIPTVILTIGGADGGRKIGLHSKQVYIDLHNSVN
jgi:thioredoxin 1